MKNNDNRIEKVISITGDRLPSDKYLKGWSWDLIDEDGKNYTWNTVTIPELSLLKGEKWRVRMTLKSEYKVLGFTRRIVERVKFLEQIK